MNYAEFYPTYIQILLGGVAASLITAYLWMQTVRRRYPPGPSPLFTNLLLNSNELLSVLKTAQRAFGSVFTVFVGPKPLVWIGDYEVMHNTFVAQADHSSSRPSGLGSLVGDKKDSGIIFSPHWKEQRKFALSVLREHGMGKIDMEIKILEEVSAFLRLLEGNCSSPVDMFGHIHKAVSNVMCNVIFGSRFEYNDPIFTSLIDVLLTQTRNFGLMTFVERLSILQALPGDIFGYHKFKLNGRRNTEHFAAVIRQHAAQLDTDNPRDFIDAYLIETKAQEKGGRETSFSEENLIPTISELFFAGTDTTSTTLRWAWLFMMLHLNVQNKVQAEIDACIGKRPPSLKDKLHMPYTEAVLTEVMRIGNTAPFTLPHKVDADVNINGQLVTKDTEITGFLTDVHMDEKNYPNPDEFRPERFIGQSGKFEKPLKFIPFGLGRRVCPGESLARAELFLFFTSILQHFNLRESPGSPLSTRSHIGLTHEPAPYMMQFIKRCP